MIGGEGDWQGAGEPGSVRCASSGEGDTVRDSHTGRVGVREGPRE